MVPDAHRSLMGESGCLAVTRGDGTDDGDGERDPTRDGSGDDGDSVVLSGFHGAQMYWALGRTLRAGIRFAVRHRSQPSRWKPTRPNRGRGGRWG
jgi:hypothetical protein